MLKLFRRLKQAYQLALKCESFEVKAERLDKELARRSNALILGIAVLREDHDRASEQLDMIRKRRRAAVAEEEFWADMSRKAVAFPGGLVNAARHLQTECHAAAAKAGWWGSMSKPDPRLNPMCFSQKLMLCVTELAEACEGDRKDLMDDHLPHRKMREVELADAVIRIFDMAGAFGMDLGGAIVEKMEYNAKRQDHKPEAREAAGGKSY